MSIRAGTSYLPQLLLCDLLLRDLGLQDLLNKVGEKSLVLHLLCPLQLEPLGLVPEGHFFRQVLVKGLRDHPLLHFDFFDFVYGLRETLYIFGLEQPATLRFDW